MVGRRPGPLRRLAPGIVAAQDGSGLTLLTTARTDTNSRNSMKNSGSNNVINPHGVRIVLGGVRVPLIPKLLHPQRWQRQQHSNLHQPQQERNNKPQ